MLFVMMVNQESLPLRNNRDDSYMNQGLTEIKLKTLLIIHKIILFSIC